MNTDLKSIVRQNRRLSGLSQIQLAKLAGVGKTVIFDIEHGKESVQFDTLRKVLAVLNIKLTLHSPAMGRSEKKQIETASST